MRTWVIHAHAPMVWPFFFPCKKWPENKAIYCLTIYDLVNLVYRIPLPYSWKVGELEYFIY